MYPVKLGQEEGPPFAALWSWFFKVLPFKKIPLLRTFVLNMLILYIGSQVKNKFSGCYFKVMMKWNISIQSEKRF